MDLPDHPAKQPPFTGKEAVWQREYITLTNTPSIALHNPLYFTLSALLKLLRLHCTEAQSVKGVKKCTNVSLNVELSLQWFLIKGGLVYLTIFM